MNTQDLVDELSLDKKNEGIKITPRELLRCFGLERRTKFNVLHVKQFLQEHDLTTIPETEYRVASTLTLNIKPRKKCR